MYLLGNHKENKEMLSLLQLSILPYPKRQKTDKQSDKDLVTGTPVKTVKKRGRPRKIKKPEDLNYGNIENNIKI